ncbi:MAG: right-handed parallel beta-helix repeat-containing protein, partial [Deltaproteobacteria bacterium]|nr:right-handed parallel beta-helix repeat-containing protein [Deltaproteobacteria bacterium]
MDKDIARYKVYRSVTPLTGYQELGTTEWNTFPDEKVEPGKKYYYKIAAIDLAGNESNGSEAAEWMLVAPGPTPVRGLIATDTLWYAGASPYVIAGEITVAPKAELRIEPGTVIQSQGEGIIVQGKLLARGDQTSLITFTGKEWRGISFQDTRDTESAIEYAKISGAAIGISCVSSSPLIAHNQIAHNQVGIRVQESFAQPKIIGNIISSNAHTGVEIAAMASPQLEDNEIRGNQENGVLIRDAKPVLVKNRIMNNGEVGVSVYSSPARLRENNIHDNGKYAVHNALENEVTVEALDNWWGFAEGRKILSQFSGRIDTQRVLDGPFPQGKSIELPILKGPLSGPIERDSFLVRMHSPYVLEKGVTIEQGATLFAEPGVVIKYNPGATLVVKDGGIDAQGTEDRMIIFSANSVSP